MSREPFNQDHVQMLDWFEGDASTFVPYPLPPRPVPPPPPAELAKARWLPLIAQHTVPGEGGRLVVKKPEGCVEAAILVDQASADHTPEAGARGRRYQGQVVSVETPGVLTVWRTYTVQEASLGSLIHEECQYIPWESVAAISFYSRCRNAPTTNG